MNVIWDNGEEVGTGEELQTGKDISQEEWERRRHRNIFIYLKVKAFKVQSPKLQFPIQKNYSSLENTVMLHCLFFLKATL